MKVRNLSQVATLSISILLGSCSPEAQQTAQNSEITPPSPVSPAISGVELDNFDRSLSPGDDFYRYVNGSWLVSTQIPADRSNYGAFSRLDDEAQENLRLIIETASSQDSDSGSDAQKVGGFFESFMDEERVNSLGAGPIQEILESVSVIISKEDLIAEMAALNRLGVQIPAASFIDNDAMQSDQYITYINQSGLGLPDRDWYLSEGNETHQAAQLAYRDYISLVMAGVSYEGAEGVADSVFMIERQLAEVQWDRVRNRQRELTYNKMTLDELSALAPDFDWLALQTGLGITEQQFIVRQPSFIEGFNAVWVNTPLQQWQDYFSFKVVDAYAAYLSEEFVQAQFAFEGQALGGIESIQPRWRRGVNTVDSALGEVVGKLYVEQYFQEESKERMDELIENLRAAFRVGIDELEWMTASTKAQAQEKLEKFSTKIGYPDTWKDYAALQIEASDLVGNVMRSRQVEHDRETYKLGQAVDRGEWFMTPHTVNAYYNPTMNEIVFPAAILQPPFFNVAADDAVNYGGIGAVIGHEFSHGFDDQGRKSDGDGNLRDWWNEADAEAFSARASALVEQYNQFEVLPGQFLNGEFTLGENIGDLSGLAVSYRAYQMSLNGEEAPIIDGLTGDQRFFIGWAQVWRRLYRDENLETRLTNDPHSHSEARTNGIVRNFDQWYQAFEVDEDDALYLAPEDRVKIW